MFTDEHPRNTKVKNQTKNTLSITGMAFVKQKTMNNKFTHKEFVLLLGVAVALLVVFIVWFNREPVAQSTQVEKSNTIPQALAPLQDGLWKKTIIELPAMILER